MQVRVLLESLLSLLIKKENIWKKGNENEDVEGDILDFKTITENATLKAIIAISTLEGVVTTLSLQSENESEIRELAIGQFLTKCGITRQESHKIFCLLYDCSRQLDEEKLRNDDMRKIANELGIHWKTIYRNVLKFVEKKLMFKTPMNKKDYKFEFAPEVKELFITLKKAYQTKLNLTNANYK